MAERLKAVASKAIVRVSGPGVRIPLSPPLDAQKGGINYDRPFCLLVAGRIRQTIDTSSGELARASDQNKLGSGSRGTPNFAIMIARLEDKHAG